MTTKNHVLKNIFLNVEYSIQEELFQSDFICPHIYLTVKYGMDL